MKNKTRGFSIKLLFALLIAVLSLTLTACFSDEETPTTAVTAGLTAGSLTLRVSQTTVKSDNSDSATITATVLDSTNAVMEGVTVTFTATGGQFNTSSSIATDSSGEAPIEFSSGADTSNQTVTITATVSGLTAKQVPIQITGSTITLTAGNTNLEVGGSDTDTLKIAVKDAGSLPISDAEVTVSVDTASTGAAILTPSTGNTDINGELEVQVTGTGAGNVTVRVQAVGTTATQAYTVSASGEAFSISSPTTDPYSLSTNTDLTITVNAPNQANVQFATTLGVWDGGADMVVTKDVSSNSASATLRSANAGVATVQVFDADNPDTTDTLTVAISAPSSEAAQIAIQASATVVAPSTGDVSNSVTLEATVNNANEEPVGNSPVAFSIKNPTGGGESISPVVAFTDSYGEATSTFTSGSLSSDAEGVTIYANVVVSNPTTIGPSSQIAFGDNNPDTITRADGGSFTADGFSDGNQIKVSGSTSNDGFYTVQTATDDKLTLVASDSLVDEAAGASVTITYAIWDSVQIVIGGTAGSVMIGLGSTILSTNNDTTYEKPMSIIVADSNGNPVQGATVSLSVWPIYYSTGYWDEPEPGECTQVITGFSPYNNEDSNKNLILDPGEDANGDGQLTPPSSAAGTVPATLTTDENGVVNFSLIYSKSSAAWIADEVTASTLVLGTETQSTYIFGLGWLEGEECSLPHSPYGI
ncbi:MAG: Ig-like domain-containing protein [Deltaproteobacteria bacterium]|nr:Ig-like domain-containing protein [Deltaproteobacteria bacterium]